MAMLGSDVREVFEKILPDDALTELVDAAGFQQRERKREALLLIRTMIICASGGRGGRQADVAESYFATGTPTVVRGSFYSWFGPALESVMLGVRDRALEYVRAQELDLPGVLGKHVRDWHIVDSTTVKLPKAMMQQYPGTGNYAALKLHKRFSVGAGTTIDYTMSPAREHDAIHLTLDESWRGLGLLCDLGYASLKLLQDCEHYDVRYVIRLKESWKPKVATIVRGTVTKTFASGTDLDVLLATEVLRLDGKTIDADVHLGPKRIPARLVGVHTSKGYCFFLTNLEASVAPRSVADLYRVRWEIELDNKLDKSCCRLDEIAARTGPAVRALAHASMVASIMVCLLAHHQRRRAAPPPRRGAQRTKPPLHSQAIARALGALAPYVARAFELRGAKAYGRTAFEASDQGVLRSGTSLITRVSEHGFSLAPSPAAPCLFDSGGPVFDDSGQVLGVISSGDAKCAESAQVMRVDTVREWLDLGLAQADARQSEPQAAPPSTRASCSMAQEGPLPPSGMFLALGTLFSFALFRRHAPSSMVCEGLR